MFVLQARHRLHRLLNHHRITMIRLARKAGVDLHIVHSIVWGFDVEPEFAVQVLKALSEMTGIQYTLEDVNINLSRPYKEAPQNEQ